MTNPLLDAALQIAGEYGFYVFPCREKNEGQYYNEKKEKWLEAKVKQPRTTRGLHDATIDKEQIVKWWNTKGWENSCIGVNCGLSKLFVIDVDNHGKDGMANFSKMLISYSGAWQVMTPNLGTHYIFADPESRGRSTTNETLGIDTRGRGGFFIVPPSYIFDDQGNKKNYVPVEWGGEMQEVSTDTLKKLGICRENKTVVREHRELPHSEEVLRAKIALDKLPISMCDNYQDWITIGMSLFHLGYDGLYLWIEWSKKSSKYQDGVCEEKWETFRPEQISLGSLFYHAKEQGYLSGIGVP